MKRNTTKFLSVLSMILSLCIICTACVANVGSAEGNGTTAPWEDPNEGRGGDIPFEYDENPEFDFGMYEGVWASETDSSYYIRIDEDGGWQLYNDGDMIDDGYLWFDSEDVCTYITSYQCGTIDGGQVELYTDKIYISTFGYFSSDGKGDYVPDNGGGYSWDDDLCQRNVKEFEGVWYYEGDLSATCYIIIDGYGNWSYYERTPGEAEGVEMDYGTFSYSTDEVSTYYADSSMHEGLSIRVFEFDDGIISWNGDNTYYRIED